MIYTFGAFELDTELFELRQEGEPVRIEPQVFDVLLHLVRHRDRVVTKDELLAEVWSDRFVSEATLSSRLMAARKAVGDSGRAQEVIRTHHGRGYRFVAPVDEVAPASGSTTPSPPPVALPETAPDPGAPAPLGVIGREAELQQVRRALTQALAGSRRVLFVTGEAGLGKSTLVQAFLDGLRGSGEPPEDGVRIARGQCLEHRGPGEAYMPVLEALGRLCREPRGGEVVELLRHRAPTWLVQMPWLVKPAALDELQARIFGATRERMLREMVEAVEALTASTPLVLVLEDLHWSDPSTVDLLSWLARRSEPARLLVIGTYRPGESSGDEQPLGPTLGRVVRDLVLRNCCTELALAPFGEDEVEGYLERRLEGRTAPAGLSGLLLRRTGGNPLFMDNLLDLWIARGALRAEGDSGAGWQAPGGLDELAAGVPETLRALVEEQLRRLEPEELELLEAGSVAGREFAAATVAAGVAEPEDRVESRCAALARRGRFLVASGTEEWPDGTVSARFAFVHDLYHQVLYERVTAGRRVRLHRWIGERLEAGHGARTGEGAEERSPELALHFVRGRNPERGVTYLEAAARRALARSAHHEAVEHLRTALGLLGDLPDPAERDRRERSLQSTLAPALVAVEGWGSPSAEAAFRRAFELARHPGDPEHLAPVLYGLATLHEYRGEYERSQELMEERLRLERGAAGEDEDGAAGGPFLVLEAHELLACSTFHQGGFERALEHAEEGLSRYDPDRHQVVTASYGENPGASCHNWAALALWFLGRPETAREESRCALELAGDPAHAYCLAHARYQAACLHQLRREPEECRRLATAAVELARERGFPYHAATGAVLRGWSLAADGQAEAGVAELRRGLDEYGATGAAMDRPYYLGLLAEAELAASRPAEAGAALDEALDGVHRGSRSFYYEAELHRLHGELALASGGRDGRGHAEESFRRALELAAEQKALALELRAATSLARLLASPAGEDGPSEKAVTGVAGRAGGGGSATSAKGSGEGADEALDLVADLYGRFTEGLDTPDLLAARTLLEDLGRPCPPPRAP